MSILSNVRRCRLAMPPVAGFLEMFAGVPYNREKNQSLVSTFLLLNIKSNLLFIIIYCAETLITFLTCEYERRDLGHRV